MTEEILDIEKWIKKYSFLNDIWNSYDEFDRPVDYDKDNHHYDVVCQRIIELSDGDIKKHKNICMKLIRNFGHYSENFKFLNSKPEDCTNLNNWVYNSMRKYNILDNIIVKCFQDYINFMKGIHTESRCSYYSYDDKYEEPINIIILNIFESNMNIILHTLNGAYDYINLPLLKYICECIKIYKEMYKKHCHNKYDNNPKRIQTCNNLNAVKRTYDIYLSGKSYRDYKIPSLDNDTEEYMTMCQPVQQKLTLTGQADRTVPVLPSLTVHRDEKKDENSPPTFIIGEKHGGSISSTVSTAFGTVAGASSILALLYKFTPGRKWIHSGLRGGGGRTSSNIYNEPNELLFDGVEHNNFNSYNIGYEAI
ncbi:PIR protein [Plasmodium vivax]|nr:PIR protein [Plasmodium vivax]